ERIGGCLDAVLIWIERELADADVTERRPAAGIAAALEALRVAHPGEQVADRVADGQPVEIIGLQPPATQRRNRFLREQRQGPEHGFARPLVAGDIEAEGVLGGEERLDGPVPSIALMPDRSAVLQ